MTRPFELRFEKERRVDFAAHQDRTWSRKPAIELLGPGTVEDDRRSEHGALNGQAERP
jgi:hypothetical protein